ncbi:uncharacterized protein LOC118201282 [Stegodyphus dumicola]|uniref:uncharacterized protein LOC118201282 n=1 Tax=Stegodyphus dumicola TaxID=202533 RepID=UPI0015B29BD7|nr:uncharacterized protein LOC118201282 [Stegodyphus dumicola]
MEYEKIAVFECMYCCKKYKKKKVLYEHIREVHKVPVVAEGNLKCPINACNFSCRTFEELRNHARDQHGYTLNSVEMTFNTYEGVRAIKSQGTCKIEGHCPSTIEVTSNGIIKILYFQTHVGHTVDLEHLPLTKDLREVIAGKLKEGIPPQKILDSTRNSIKEDIYREHLLTKKDIHNISNSYCIGEAADQHLEISDFCIIIMTNVQKHMLLKFGSDSICIDSTHGTNAYDFQLSTVLVIDEFNSGFPAAFCLSNRVNLGSMQKFFQCIRDKVGLLSVNCFMSDDAPVYYTAWTSVMCDAKFRILCTWHVKKAWLQAANSIIPSKRKEVLKFLNVVSECHDIKEFEALISDFLSKLFADRDTDKFANIFASNYANRCELWAKCYRKRCNITTNNHLEALHRVLKLFLS